MAAAIETHREKVERMQKLCVYPAPANGIALAFGGTLICIDLLDKASSLEKIWSRYQEGLLIDLLERQHPEREITGARDFRQIGSHAAPSPGTRSSRSVWASSTEPATTPCLPPPWCWTER